MEETASRGERRTQESAPVGFLWASNQFANGLIQELTNYATASLILIDSIEKSAPPGPASDLAMQLGKSIRMCGRLIAQSKRIIENISHNSTNLNEVTDFSVRLLRHVIHRNVQLESQLDPAVDVLEVQIKDLEMVLAVLLIRAREALHGEGSITIKTRYAHLDTPRRTRFLQLLAGDYATLSIACSNKENTDQGWEQWLSERCDEGAVAPSSPFVRSLLDAMGAQIDVALDPYVGATLILYFPVCAIDVPIKPAELGRCRSRTNKRAVSRAANS
jgi:hypothetical protein